MVARNRRRWWKPEQPSASSLNYFRTDVRRELEEQQQRAGDQEQQLERLKLQIQLAKKGQSPPENKQKQEVAEAHERAGDAKAFLEKEQARDLPRKEALQQGPEVQTEEQG
jgi:hypothetical protein